jgi:class 3 adenylate cyclase
VQAPNRACLRELLERWKPTNPRLTFHALQCESRKRRGNPSWTEERRAYQEKASREAEELASKERARVEAEHASKLAVIRADVEADLQRMRLEMPRRHARAAQLIQGVIEREFKQHHGAQEKLDAAKAEQRKLEKTEHEAIIADLLAHQDMQRLAAAWGNAADREVTALNPDVLKPKEAGTAPASPEQDIESHDRIDRAIEKLPDH